MRSARFVTVTFVPTPLYTTLPPSKAVPAPVKLASLVYVVPLGKVVKPLVGFATIITSSKLEAGFDQVKSAAFVCGVAVKLKILRGCGITTLFETTFTSIPLDHTLPNRVKARK